MKLTSRRLTLKYNVNSASLIVRCMFTDADPSFSYKQFIVILALLTKICVSKALFVIIALYNGSPC